MKVYIVTSGDYSEYGINRVFSTKEKAEKWISLQNDEYNEYRTKEWNVDNCDYKQGDVIDIQYGVQGESNIENEYRVSISKCAVSDGNLGICVARFSMWKTRSTNESVKYLKLKANITNSPDEIDDIKDKYHKICQDLMTHISSLISVEEWSEDMINEWLEEKYSTKNPV